MANGKPVTFEGMRTPWGAADAAYLYAPGIGGVGTPSHGGIKLDRAHQAKVPDYLRRAGGWYEEDIDWAIPFMVFANELLETGTERFAKDIVEAGRTLVNWLPDEFQRFTGQVLKTEDSMVLRERGATARALAANALRLASALGGPSTMFGGVPAGFVGAYFGPADYDRRPGGPEMDPAPVLVPQAEYQSWVDDKSDPEVSYPYLRVEQLSKWRWAQQQISSLAEPVAPAPPVPLPLTSAEWDILYSLLSRMDGKKGGCIYDGRICRGDLVVQLMAHLGRPANVPVSPEKDLHQWENKR